MSWARALVTVAFATTIVSACSSSAEEGEACDRANGNDDCETGLICRGEWEVQATESVCCPRPPAKPSTAACEPELEHHVPDPSIDASYGAGGSGGGGSGGSSGAAGTAGAAGSPGDSGSDAAGGAANDGALEDGAGGAAGGAGQAGSGGKPGKDGGGKPDGG